MPRYRLWRQGARRSFWVRFFRAERGKTAPTWI